jgi:hypothetical protein
LSPIPHLRTETDPFSETFFSVVFRIAKLQNPVILNVARTLKIYLIECFSLKGLFLCGRKFTDFRLSCATIADDDSAIWSLDSVIWSLQRTNMNSVADV